LYGISFGARRSADNANGSSALEVKPDRNCKVPPKARVRELLARLLSADTAWVPALMA